jgi:uncharacterized tellurite resistance protein B-like protein
MTLPTLLAEDFEKVAGRRPNDVARALYSLDGSLGVTWMSTDGYYLVFHFKPAGGNFCRKAFTFADALRVETKTEDCFAVFRVRFPEATYELKFSLWDIAVLDRIARYWNPERTEFLAAAPKTLTPLSAFCAGIHAIIEGDGDADELELEWLGQRMPDRQAIQEGGAWIAANGTERLLAIISDVLTPQQRECLFANQISASMSDDLLRSSEQELIEKFREAMGIKADRCEAMLGTMLVKNQIGAVIAETEGGLIDVSSTSPVVIFAACLIAMSECDEEQHATEEAYLRRLVEREEVVIESGRLLEFKGLDGLIAALPGPLDEIQCRCLMVNLLGLAMVDGQLKGPEQELIGRFQEALRVNDSEFHWDLEVLLAKNNLAVLAGAA